MSIGREAEKINSLAKDTVVLPTVTFVGIGVRTSNMDELNLGTAKIAETIQKYMSEAVYDKIPHRKTPGKTYCIYTEYESDHAGEYTYFIGEEIDSLTKVPEGLKAIIVPSQSYAKFTTAQGVMPQVCIDGWMQIWKMATEDFGGKRSYVADFEVYDERALDPTNTVLDIYIGIKH